jgi:ABC-type antimicrobial peptide transport system permease subunit
VFDDAAIAITKKMIGEMYQSRDRDFANGRTMRQLFDSICKRQAQRLEKHKLMNMSDEQLMTIVEEDIPYEAPKAVDYTECLAMLQGLVGLESVKKEISNLLGDKFKVQDRYEQQDDVFRIMRIEKLISYLFLTFILLVACFNIIGSLSMLMIEKKQDVQTLRSMGATDKQICNIFMFEGRMISMAGATIGLLLGLLLCWLQQEYGLISMGQSEGSFIVEAYPVSVHPWDLVLIFVTVLLVGWAAVWYPVRYLSKNLL